MVNFAEIKCLDEWNIYFYEPSIFLTGKECYIWRLSRLKVRHFPRKFANLVREHNGEYRLSIDKVYTFYFYFSQIYQK